MQLCKLQVPGYLSLRDSAARLGINIDALRLRIRRGLVKATKVGPAKMFLRKEDVEHMLAFPPKGRLSRGVLNGQGRRPQRRLTAKATTVTPTTATRMEATI